MFNETVVTVHRRGSAGQRTRVVALCQEMFGKAPTDPSVAALRYQLVYGAFAAVRLAHREGRTKAMFLVQVFVNELCSLRKIKDGRRELNRFLRLLRRGMFVSRSAPVTGPFSAPNGCSWIPIGVELYVARVETWQHNPGP